MLSGQIFEMYNNKLSYTFYGVGFSAITNENHNIY